MIDYLYNDIVGLHVSTIQKLIIWGFPGGPVVASAEASGGTELIPGPARRPRVRNGNPLQYSCLGNSMDKGAWLSIVHGVAELCMTDHACANQAIILHVFIM